MRSLVVASIALVVVAGIGYTICLAIGVDPHARDLALAGAIALVASTAAIVPMLLNQGADQAASAQAALIATLVHLFIAALLAGAGILVLKLGPAFTWWLFAFYFTTLVAIAGAAVRFVRHAPLAKTNGH